MVVPLLSRDEVQKRIQKGARPNYNSKEPFKYNAWTVIAMVENGKMTIPMLQKKAQELRRVSRAGLSLES
jgi:hypothetical protein